MATKVFVGNLSYRTTPETLGTLFGEAGAVKDVRIISKGNYSLGFAFVEMATEADAIKAVANVNKKELDGRVINVEIAKPRDPNAPPPTTNRRFSRFPRRPRAPTTGAPTSSTTTPATTTTTAAPRAPKVQPAPPTGNADFDAGYTKGFADGRAASRRPRRRFPRENTATGTAPAAGAPAPRPRQFRPARVARAPLPDSPTRLFISNLPPTVTAEQLGTIFAPFGVTEARIAVRPTTGRPRGFAFLTVASQADQQRAIAQMNGYTIGDKVIVVAIGREPPPPQTAAPTTTAPAPAA